MRQAKRASTNIHNCKYALSSSSSSRNFQQASQKLYVLSILNQIIKQNADNFLSEVVFPAHFVAAVKALLDIIRELWQRVDGRKTPK